MTAKEQVLKVYPDAQIRTLGYYDWHSGNRYRRAPFIATGYYIHIPTVWMPRANDPYEAWQSSLTKINENGTTSNPSAEEA